MNIELCTSTDAALNDYSVQTQTFMVEENYETAPIALTKIAYQPLNEEELHLSFEEAIDSRVVALQEQLSHLRRTDSLLDSGSPSTNASLSQGAARSLLGYGWKRGIIFCGLALIFTLIGFNLMGLLILSTR